MAITGLSVPLFGRYATENGIVSYSEGEVIGHAVEYSIDIEVTDDVNLFGDSMIVEIDKGVFRTGTLTLNASAIPDYALAWLFNLTPQTVSDDNGGTVTQYVFDDDLEPLVVGFGIVEQHRIDGATYYKSVILPKCTPRFPADAAVTQGETIDWQTTEIELRIDRSDAVDHPWKVEAWHDTELEAREYMHQVLGYEGNVVGKGRVGYMVTA